MYVAILLSSTNGWNLWTEECPDIWICGDCHVGNLGPVASAEGKVEIEIRDLDQTVIGNPAHDLIRLALSLATAARGSDLPGVSTALMMEEMIVGYEEALVDPTQKPKPSGKATEPIQFVLKQSLKRKWRHLAEERIEDVKPSIPLGERFWTLSQAEKQAIVRLFDSEEVRKLITCLRQRKSKSSVDVLDASYWMKGCSSLGKLRFAVLAGIGSRKKTDLCLIDIKEAVRAAAPRAQARKCRGTMPSVLSRALATYRRTSENGCLQQSCWKSR